MTIPLWKQYRPEILKPYLEQKDREKELLQLEREKDSLQSPFKGAK